MKLAKTIEELPDVFIPVPDLKRLVATLRKCESTAKLLSETLPAKGGGNLAHELLGEIREVLG